MMDAEVVLRVVLREMGAYGQGWRLNWSEFDGRQLRYQLEGIDKWATQALSGSAVEDDYTAGSEFLKEQGW